MVYVSVSIHYQQITKGIIVNVQTVVIKWNVVDIDRQATALDPDIVLLQYVTTENGIQIVCLHAIVMTTIFAHFPLANVQEAALMGGMDHHVVITSLIRILAVLL